MHEKRVVSGVTPNTAMLAMGLYPEKHLGKTLGQMRVTLRRLNDEIGSAPLSGSW